MNFPLPSSRARAAVLVGSILLAVVLSYAGIRNGRAAYAFGLDTRAGYERAVQLEPNDSRNWYFLGRSYLYDFEQPDPERAIQALRRAVALDPYSVEAWLDLAIAYDGEGDPQQARAAYLSAKHIYPLSADASWSFGNFLLRQNEPDAAFVEIRRAVELEPRRAAEAFMRASRVEPDAGVLLDKAIPRSAEDYLAVLKALADSDNLDSARVVWNRLLALNQKVPLREMVGYIELLFRRKQGHEARQAWMQAVSIMQDPPPPDPPGSLVWDGGFESAYAGGGFAWRFQASSRDTQIALDRSEKHSGAQSLRILFAGRENLNFSDGCNYIAPEPGRKYLLTAWVKTQSLTSSEGIRLQIVPYDVNEPVATESVGGTTPWKQIQLAWTAPQGSTFAQICARRYQSDQPESRIQGAAWLDDIAVVPADHEPAQP